MTVEVSLNTPLAEALSNVVQPKLTEVGWSTGGLDDSALTEYIILMLVNGKTQEQIAAELSNDLLNLDPDDSGATEFANWLFRQVDVLQNQISGNSTKQLQAPPQNLAQQAQGHDNRLDWHADKQSNGSVNSPDMEMGEAVPADHDGAIPTGPKSMRNSGRNMNGRLMGQISKAMDRSNDAVLHRVRVQQGTGRINMHTRQPPKGPRIDPARNHRPSPNGRVSGMPPAGMVNGSASTTIMNMTPQQQMQLLAMYEEQARMMSQIFSPQQQQMLISGVPQPAINPATRQQQGKSLFERIEANPHGQTGRFQRRESLGAGRNMMLDNKSSQSQQPSNGDIISSMEVESSQTDPSENPTATACRFNLSCTKKDCPFAHQSPAAPPGTAIDMNDDCPFGVACKNRKCVGRHPSPSQKTTHQSEQDCRFFPNCTNAACPFRHPTMPMCRNGADCTRDGCKFTHVNITCRFNPCLNPTCPYKHAEGQKRGVFNDKVWTADGGQEKDEHVSDRKFVDDRIDGEELIVPSNQQQGSGSSDHGTEIAT